MSQRLTERQPEPRPSGLGVLRIARALLEERGWAPAGQTDGPTVLIGPETGPLSVTQALWRASKCYPPSSGQACRLLCDALGMQAGSGFVELGRWCRAEGRTQAEILRLFSRAISTANRRLFEAIFAADPAEETVPA